MERRINIHFLSKSFAAVTGLPLAYGREDSPRQRNSNESVNRSIKLPLTHPIGLRIHQSNSSPAAENGHLFRARCCCRYLLECWLGTAPGHRKSTRYEDIQLKISTSTKLSFFPFSLPIHKCDPRPKNRRRIKRFRNPRISGSKRQVRLGYRYFFSSLLQQ